ncbi:type VI secretion system baseplate subunit TssK [Enterovibrio sp. ZSDZ35]|uniref:Type VI secretion system baseplate subunit TssK n=1 Tax=Enterovibrio qingdaonensis TaxID=2899818 RepID=A0ABT5QHR1_9GAMM|nr:type VI secretion system baseplate subunit TssK [Enterovibrio sp. ZSDZ35]MDD1780508.1 type VI secretion system baseplate subunit TssK [Enterovibrio sp. ZSDZ35]
MTVRNRVIWNEGLFIKPQHFQQMQRNFEYQLEERVATLNQHLYGITDLAFNAEYLSFGRVALERVGGVMPDGTVFNVPNEDTLPTALEISSNDVANQIVYLSIPLRSDTTTEINWPDSEINARFNSKRQNVRDTHSQNGDGVVIDVSPVCPKIMLESHDRSAYASIAIGRILEKRPDGSVLLDETFIPCHLKISAVPRLYRFVGEMAGLMHERAKNIAYRLGTPSQGGVAEVTDFMLLQALNRLQPMLQHLSKLPTLHPERLYAELSAICGELSTFTDESRLAPDFKAYRHDLPTEALNELLMKLRQSLSIVLEPKAVSIQLHQRKYGLMVAPIHDPGLLDDAEFIVAVRAKLPQEELRKLFTQQTKVASVEKIRELISLQLPGVPLSPLPIAPRQLPYHAGYIYYQLDKSSQAWSMLINGSGFAFHVAGHIPDVELQFWAIRS